MTGEAWTAVGGVVVVIITALLAPRLDAKRRERAEAVANAAGERKTELDVLREEQRDLRLALKEQVTELRAENVSKDARIEVLEAKVNELRNLVEMFRSGLTHPPGYILVPANIWSSLRERFGDQLPPGPFVGETDHSGPQFGRLGLTDPKGPR